MQQDGPLQIGQLLAGKYRVERMLGRGGMGAVYAARHEQLGETFAIKVLLPEVGGSSQAANRFLNEAKAASQIKGEHVARVTDVGQDQGLSYMVLELLDGEDVAAALEKRGRFQVHEAVDICMEALEAVAQAHIRSIVHRDLKPANLFLSRCEDGSTIVKVLDFGISKASNPFALDSQNAALTSTKAMLGSPLYMSPEQLRSAKSVTAQSDLWSMGVILYELMAGRVPFMGESLGELFVAILESPMQPLQAVRPDVPAQLVAAVHRCLERDLSRRVSSVLELANLLAPFGTARSTASLESIRGIYARAHGAQSPVASTSSGGGAVHLAQSGSGAVPAASFLPAAPTGANTNHTWGKTNDPAVDAGLPRRSSTGVLVALTIGAVVLVGGGGGGYALYARQQVAAHRAADARLAIENGAAAGDGIAQALATAAAAASAPSAVPTPTAATRPAPAGGGAGSDGAPAGASGGGGGGGGGGATTAGGGGGGGGTSTHATRHTGGGTATSTSTGTKASGSGTLATKPASTGSIDLLHVDRKAQ